MNYKEFAIENGLEFRSVKVFENPNMSDMLKGSNHYQVKITRVDRFNKEVLGQMIIFFSMGPALKGKPAINDILESLVIDTANLDYGFENWCDDYGYDTDSKRAHETYHICLKEAKELKTLLGEDLLNKLYDITGD
jgi:hypothetical protein